MDPTLVDLLWEIHTELGSREPIHIISGYRSRATNEMLRETVGGQASQSRHILGKAADVHFPDVPLKRLRYSALIRERGGVGYYPTSAIPFVHVDTDRVRHWPRMPRDELALLFPDGHSQHVPADGVPIKPEDVQSARARNRELATQVAEVQTLHRQMLSGARFAVADAGAAVFRAQPQQAQLAALATPKLVAEPRLVDRPSRLVASAIPEPDRQKLTQLAALASFPEPGSEPEPPGVARGGPILAALALPEPVEAAATMRFGWGGGWAPTTPAGRPPIVSQPAVESWAAAPAYDEEHPEELAYRPFPLTSYMTDTPSPDDPALARMEKPDFARTLEVLDQAGAMPPMRLRPREQVAQLLWAQEFKGDAVALDGSFDRLATDPMPGRATAALSNRLVRTTQP